MMAVLETFPLFTQLSEATRQAIIARGIERRVPGGQLLIVEDASAEACYFILSGTVRVLRSNPEGRIQVLARLSQGAPVNVVSLLLAERKNQSTVETLTAAALFTLSAENFDILLEDFPEFSKTLLKLFANRIAQMTDLAAGLSLYSVRVRLARFLIELAETDQPAGGWTQDEIAAQIGTVRDVVGRLLRDFEQEGLIQRSHQQILLVDRAGIYQEAGIADSHHKKG